MQIVLFLGDLDCTPPDDSLCADVEDGYIIYHFYPCKLASIYRKLNHKYMHMFSFMLIIRIAKDIKKEIICCNCMQKVSNIWEESQHY